MTLPLALLNDNTDNVYELSVAMTRRAYQIALSGEADRVDEKANGADEVNEKADGVERENESVKPVVTAIRQVLTKTVHYQLEG